MQTTKKSCARNAFVLRTPERYWLKTKSQKDITKFQLLKIFFKIKLGEIIEIRLVSCEELKLQKNITFEITNQRSNRMRSLPTYNLFIPNLLEEPVDIC